MEELIDFEYESERLVRKMRRSTMNRYKCPACGRSEIMNNKWIPASERLPEVDKIRHGATG